MLACGADWRPTKVKRVVETLRTSTRVAKVATDGGIGFLKGMGNPAGNGSLACELVGTELARWFGLKTPPFALLRLDGVEIPMEGHTPVEPGPAFISKEVQGMTADGGDAFLAHLENVSDVAKVVVFDTWIRNSDRYPADEQEQDAVSNRDNLFFHPIGQKFELVVFDHSHCFTEGVLADTIHDEYLLRDDRLYGYFPEFRKYVSSAAVNSAIHRLRQMDRTIAEEIVGSVPSEWEVTGRTRTQWAEVICARAELVASTIARRLGTDVELGL